MTLQIFISYISGPSLKEVGYHRQESLHDNNWNNNLSRATAVLPIENITDKKKTEEKTPFQGPHPKNRVLISVKTPKTVHNG